MENKGYLLHGVTGEILLVFRTDDPDEARAILKKLQGIRSKEIKELAYELEKDLDDENFRDNGVSEPENTKEVLVRKRSKTRKTANG